MKKKIYIIGILIAFTVGLIVLRPERSVLQQPAATDTAVVSISTTSDNVRIDPTPLPSAPQPQHSSSTSTTMPAPTPDVTITVGSSTYAVYAAPGASVLDAMRAAVSSTAFTFTGRDYPSLGFYVESIGGKQNGDGYYWFLYLNGKSSDTGASQTVLHSSDRVEWRYERSY